MWIWRRRYEDDKSEERKVQVQNEDKYICLVDLFSLW